MNGRSIDSTDIRDGEGQVVARQATPMRCSYLVTMTGVDRTAEHRAMGRLLRASPIVTTRCPTSTVTES